MTIEIFFDIHFKNYSWLHVPRTRILRGIEQATVTGAAILGIQTNLSQKRPKLDIVIIQCIWILEISESERKNDPCHKNRLSESIVND